jgi:hypothetical protein
MKKATFVAKNVISRQKSGGAAGLEGSVIWRASAEAWNLWPIADGLAGLIPRHPGVDLITPGLDAPSHRLSVLESLLTKPSRRAVASPALVAMNDNAVAFMPGKFAKPVAKLTHGNERRAVDLADGRFVRIADINEHEILAGGLHLGHVANGDFDGSLVRAHSSRRQGFVEDRQ